MIRGELAANTQTQTQAKKEPASKPAGNSQTRKQNRDKGHKEANQRTNGQTNERQDKQTIRLLERAAVSQGTWLHKCPIKLSSPKCPEMILSAKTVRCRLQAHWRVHSHLKSQIAFGLSSHKDRCHVGQLHAFVGREFLQNNPSQPRATHSDMTSLPGRLLRLRTKQARCFIVFFGVQETDPRTLWDHIGGRPLWFSKSGTSWRGWCCIMVHRNIFPSFSYPADLKWLEPHMYILCELGILKLLCKGRFGWGFKVHPTSKHMIIFTCMS